VVRWLQGRGVTAREYRLDVTDEVSIRDLHRRLTREGELPDILVNNAGIAAAGEFLDVPVDRHLLTYRVNTVGPMLVTHRFLPDLLARPQAYLVNIISASALLPLPGATTYASSKWALLGFTESLREELRRAGHDQLRLLAVCPGYIATGLFAGVRPPRMAPLLCPDRVAKQVIQAIRRNREQLTLPASIRLIPAARALLPRSWCRWLADWLGVSNALVTPEPTARPASSPTNAGRAGYPRGVSTGIDDPRNPFGSRVTTQDAPSRQAR